MNSDEIFGVPPQMKLNPPSSPAARQISSRSDFIHDGGFIPTKADLVEKSTHCLGRQMCAFFCLKRDKRCLNGGNNEKKVSAFAQRVCSDKQQFVYP